MMEKQWARPISSPPEPEGGRGGRAGGGAGATRAGGRGGRAGMPCPLRVPLAALSAAGAVAVALGALEVGGAGAGGAPGGGAKGGGPAGWAWLAFLLDLFSGRYLYELWRGGQRRGAGREPPKGLVGASVRRGGAAEGKKAA